MTGCTTIKITVTEDKKVNCDIEGKLMHPIEISKVLLMVLTRYVATLKSDEEDQKGIVTPDKRIITP
jgi:hypothetical protein